MASLKSEIPSEVRETKAQRNRKRDNANSVHPVTTISYGPGYMQGPEPSRELSPEEQEVIDDERFNRERRMRKLRNLKDMEIKSEELDVEGENLKKTVSVRLLRKELKDLEAQEDAAKAQRRGAEGDAPPQASEGEDVPLSLVEKLAEFPDDKKQAFLQTYTMVKMAQRNATGSGDMGGLAPFLLMFSQNHNSPDIAKYGENLVSALKTGAAMVKDERGGESLSDKMAMKAFDMLQADKSAPQRSGAHELLDTIKGLKEAGLVLSPADVTRMINDSKANVPPSGANATEVELKRLDTDHAIRMAEINSNEKVEMAKLGTESERTDALTGVAGRIFTTAGRALARGEVGELLGDGQQAAPSRTFPPAVRPPQAGEPNVAREPCPHCGAELVIPEPQRARFLTCVKCGANDIEWTPPTP